MYESKEFWECLGDFWEIFGSFSEFFGVLRVLGSFESFREFSRVFHIMYESSFSDLPLDYKLYWLVV